MAVKFLIENINYYIFLNFKFKKISMKPKIFLKIMGYN